MAAKTIAAISTPPGKGGVAVIRISGDDAFSIAHSVFRPRSAKAKLSFPKRVPVWGDILHSGEPIDDGLLTLFPAPNSYTGEDMAEISCHGGILITSKVLEAVLIAGAYPAERGEFTRRAFLSGKLTLTEAEAIGLLLDAKSEAQIKLSRADSRGRLSSELDSIRSSITALLSSLYARIDYPDEDLGDFSDGETVEEIDKLICKTEALISTYKTGHAVSEGIRTVICGKPNVGKSTLYNLLLLEEAAIVTDIPGTTRDVLEGTVALGDVMLKISDTAGIRDGEVDTVEAIGISRSVERIEKAELIIALFDSSREPDGEDLRIIRLLRDADAPCIAVITKIDDGGYSDKIRDMLRDIHADAVLEISAKHNGDAARDLLTKAADELFKDERIKIGDDAIISSARQNAALIRARDHLKTAKEAFLLGISQDAASSDIELALGAIAQIDGRAVSEEVVADIFAKFCVGK